MEVEFVTLGDAAKRLDVPAPTLRGWADKLEELGVHYLERNHRDERIFYESDIKIFEFMKEAKDRYGRKTTTTDLAYVIAESEDLQCRQKGQVPEVPKHKAQLSELDIEHILQHPDFQTFLTGAIERATKGLSREIAEQVRKSIKKEMDAKIDDIEARRIKKMDEFIAEQRKTQRMMKEYMSLPFHKRLFAKNPFKEE